MTATTCGGFITAGVVMAQDTTGFSLPFRVNPTTGGIELRSGDEKLKENLRHLLMTVAGERVMRGTYGGGVRTLLQDPNDEVLQAFAQYSISKAIIQWEPRVVIQAFDVVQEQENVYITIRYSRRDSAAQDTLILEGTVIR